MKKNQLKVYIEFMGCPKRGLDATKFKNYFLRNGARIVNRPKQADYILYVSCAFVKERQDGAIKRINQLKRCKGNLIVAGCLKAINNNLLQKHFSGITLTTTQPHKIDSIFPQFKISFKNIPDANEIYPISKINLFKENIFAFRFDFNFIKRAVFYLKRRFDSKYAHIRICWGCETEHCSFCVVWRAVGPLRSKPIQACVDELKKALGLGKNKIILLANNTGAYGIDISTSLPELLEALLAVKGNFTLEIEDFHPFWLIKYRQKIINLLETKKISALHCPIQSGSNRMLKLMNRRYYIEEVKNAFLACKKAYPELGINTQILLGFFSESEEDFYQTLSFLSQVDIKLVQIYTYTEHPNTNINLVKGKRIPEIVKKRRLKEALVYCKRNNIICAAA